MYDTPITFLKDENTPASILVSILIAKYGTELFDWDPAVLRKEIEEDFGVELTEVQSDKIQAVITIITTDLFETNWHVFTCCVNAMSGEYIDPEVMAPVEAEYIAGILPEVELLRNEDHEGIEFSDEVNAYAGLIFAEYGCGRAPTIFQSAIMPKGYVADADMTEKNAALSEIYQAKKESLNSYIKRIRDLYTV